MKRLLQAWAISSAAVLAVFLIGFLRRERAIWRERMGENDRALLPGESAWIEDLPGGLVSPDVLAWYRSVPRHPGFYAPIEPQYPWAPAEDVGAD